MVTIFFLTFFLRINPSRSFSAHVSPSSSSPSKKIVWFRDHALRINDNEALTAAVKESLTSSSSILPVYLWTSSAEEKSQLGTGRPVDKSTGGTARDVFVANALDSLNSTLGGTLSLGLVNDRTDFAEELVEICRQAKADEVYYLKSHDAKVEDFVINKLCENGITPRPFGGAFSLIDYSQHDVPWKDIILEHPWRSPLIPFVDYVLRQMEERPLKPALEAPEGLNKVLLPDVDVDSKSLVSNPYCLQELLNIVGITPGGTEWGTSISNSWPANENQATKALCSFLESLEETDDGMKRMHLASRLSPYLARGMLSPKQVYSGIVGVGDKSESDSFIRRICWRDYTYAVVALYPDVTNGKAIRDGYESLDDGISIDSEDKMRRLECWKKGTTGFPLIDAGMRQLVAEGWMPQKVRLACSTFLIEGLGLSWRDGMRHFADFLVDYDEAINSNMWMNAGCVGLDPYYVGMNYKRRSYWDNNGDYVRKWCPEIANLPDSVGMELGNTNKTVDCLYEPWASPPGVLGKAGVTLGKTYPERVCDERESRSQFFTEVRELRAQWSPSMIDDRKRDLVGLGPSAECERIGLFTPRAFQVRQPRH